MIAWKRANLKLCTVPMLDVLKRLRDAHDDKHPFIYLDDVHGRTIRSLTTRDWIVKSVAPKNLDRPRYKITGRGLRACAIYEIPPEEYDPRRYDGICPRCGERERGCYKTGTIRAYCMPCDRAIGRRNHRLYGSQKKPGICPACNKRDKHITPSGDVKSYCLPCCRQKSKIYRRRKYKREREQVARGEELLCYRCHQKPRYVTGNTVQDYCIDCTREYRMSRRRI